MSTILSASFIINAETSQPWSIIGSGQWIGAGKWWLLRAQLELRTTTEPEQNVAPASYANSIKPGWILVDFIPCHPQIPFVSASRNSELQSLSAGVKNEFSRITTLALLGPALDELQSQDLRLWESISVKLLLLRPYKVSQILDAWRADGGEHVLFRRSAFRQSNSITTIPCILLFLVHESAKAARLIAQGQHGDIVKAVSFQKLPFQEYVDCEQGVKSVMVGREKDSYLNHVQEAQVVRTIIETTNFTF